MWNSIKELTDYKTKNQLPNDDAILPDVPNQFFARYETQREEVAPFINPR